MKVAFVVERFPVVSETFIINQVADLLNRGIQVHIFSFNRGDTENVSQRFYAYNLAERVTYLSLPAGRLTTYCLLLFKVLSMSLTHPLALRRIFRYRREHPHFWLTRLIFWAEPFVRTPIDLAHCHFGPAANQFLIIREMLAISPKFITTFYGYDASLTFRQQPRDYYAELQRECSLFFVMSDDMRRRLIEHGFDERKIRVLPVSIDVSSYPYAERVHRAGEMIKIISVGRFIEKKGFDDLLRAMDIVKQRSKQPFKCYIIGDGALRDDLVSLATELHLKEDVEFKGTMRIEDIITWLRDAHLFVQPSKTSRNGDME